MVWKDIRQTHDKGCFWEGGKGTLVIVAIFNFL